MNNVLLVERIQINNFLPPSIFESILKDMPAPQVSHLGIGSDNVTYSRDGFNVSFNVHSESKGNIINIMCYNDKIMCYNNKKFFSFTEIPDYVIEKDNDIFIGFRKLYRQYIAPHIEQNYTEIKESRQKHIRENIMFQK